MFQQRLNNKISAKGEPKGKTFQGVITSVKSKNELRHVVADELREIGRVRSSRVLLARPCGIWIFRKGNHALTYF